MIPILYDESEEKKRPALAFTTSYICYLAETITCSAVESVEGIFECEFQYPVWGKYYSEIREGRYVCVKHDDTDDIQPFKIYKRSAPLEGNVTFFAHHISYIASRVIVKPYSASSASTALSGISTNSINWNPFSFNWEQIAVNAQFNIDVPTSARAILLGKDSIRATYGGEYKFDKFDIRLMEHRGIEKNVTIRYGKNLTGIDQTIDTQNLYNAIVPYWSGKIEGVDTMVMVEENGGLVRKEGVANENVIAIAKDYSSEFKNMPDSAALKARAEQELAETQPDVPTENIKVNFLQLWQTDDYEDARILQNVSLGDKLSVYYPELGVTAKGVEVIKVEYDVLAERYERMELGKAELKTFTDQIKEEQEEKIEKKQSVFEYLMEREIMEATQKLLNPGSSHVLFYKADTAGTDDQFTLANIVTGNGAMEDAEGILIMDTNDPLTATDVLIINKSGIGFSDAGVSGPYKRSWTLDGHFTTDFISTWELLVNMIRLYGLMEVHKNEEAQFDSNGNLIDDVGGYLGFGYGRIDATTRTDGIMLSNTDNRSAGTPTTNNRYVIATTSGVRMTAGDNSFYLTDNLIQGQASGNAVLHTVNNYIMEIGGDLKIKDASVSGSSELTGFTAGSSPNYTFHIGPATLRIFKGIVIGGTEWTKAEYDALVQRIVDLEENGGGGGGGGGGGTAVFG